MISKYFDKDNLHHAYLIEGVRDEIVPEIIKFLEEIGVNTVGSSDFTHVKLDSLKIEDARNLKSYGSQKGFSPGKKVFIISANNILLEAQNSMLKMFEEPIENTHFFLIVPDANVLLHTFVSRFYLIKAPTEVGVPTEVGKAEKFIAMPLRNRIDFIKGLLEEEENEDEEGNVPMLKGIGIPTASVGKITNLDSTRSKSLKFLNALEFVLHSKFLKNSSGVTPPTAWTLADKNFSETCFQYFFKVREFLRMPGSSVKSLMESVALILPDFSK